MVGSLRNRRILRHYHGNPENQVKPEETELPIQKKDNYRVTFNVDLPIKSTMQDETLRRGQMRDLQAL